MTTFDMGHQTYILAKPAEQLEVGGRVPTIGIDWGPGGLELVYRKQGYGIIKWLGHMAWQSIGSDWVYSPTHYFLVEFGQMGYSGTLRPAFRTLKEIAPGRKWRATVEEFKQEIAQLHAARKAK